MFSRKHFNFIRPSGTTVFNCHNQKGVKVLTRLRLGLSHHLHEHEFKHSFQDSLNPTCRCDNDIKKSAHLLFHCSNFLNERSTFLNIIRIVRKILRRHNSEVTAIVIQTIQVTLSFECRNRFPNCHQEI